jgi:hypothetical protein
VTYRITLTDAATCWTVVRARRTIAEADSLVGAADALVVDLQSTLARIATGWTFIHAGVVAINDRALLLPGRSHVGKSTLVAALLRAGAAYGSDEFAVLDRNGLVHPYPRPLAMRAPVTRLSPEALGASTLSEGCLVAAVLFTTFVVGERLAPKTISSGEVVLYLLEHTLAARARAPETLAALQALAITTHGFIGPRGDADEAAKILIDCAMHDWQCDTIRREIPPYL